jgi:hypothetical protein
VGQPRLGPYGNAPIDPNSKNHQRHECRNQKDSQAEPIRKLKEMLRENETSAKRMRGLIAEMEKKAKDSKEKKRPSD